MIDYVEAIIRCRHTPFGDTACYTNAKTGNVKQRKKEVNVKNGISNIKVRSMRNGRSIKLSGNPLMFLQQQNLFGTNDLIGLVHGMFMKAASLLHIKVSELAGQRILEGKFVLRRVDIALNFTVPQQDCVNKVIRAIGQHWFEQNKNLSTYPNQTAYLNQCSKIWTLKFYNKYQQLVEGKKQLPHKAKLLEYAKRLVRAELTLRFPALKNHKRKLRLGSSWSDKSLPRQLLLKAINGTVLSGKFKLCLMPREIAALPASMKRIYVSWSHGESIKGLYGTASFYRAKKQFKKLGIDISIEPHKSRTKTINLADLFTENNVAIYPRLARKMGLIYFPRSRN